MDTKIVIVSGQEFQVPAQTETAAIRQHLANTFPDVATADVKTGKKTIDGQEYETLEFVKKAGTKGVLDAPDLAALLARVPADVRALPKRSVGVAAVVDGSRTFAELLRDDRLTAQIDAASRANQSPNARGANLLCHACTTLHAVPSAVPAW